MSSKDNGLPQSQTVIGAILAGGCGSRIGTPKATLELAGRPLIDYPLSALRAAAIEPVVVAKPATSLPKLAVPVWREPTEPTHPLCGIVTALHRAAGRPVLICGCDMPFITSALITWLADHSEHLVVPRVGDLLQPALALYGADMIDPLTRALDAQRPIHRAIRELEPLIIEADDFRRFGDPQYLFFNINTHQDLAHAEELLAG